MHIRPASLADVPVLAEIGAKAFANDPIHAYLFPWRSQYPDDFYRFFEEDIRKALATVGQLVMLAEIDDTDQFPENTVSPPGDTAGRVVAYATFIRSGNPAECALWNADSLSKSMHMIIPFTYALKKDELQS